jgi:hypothetical protein
LGIGDWGLGIGPNPQSPIPNPQSPIPLLKNYKIKYELQNLINKIFLIISLVFKERKQKLNILIYTISYSIC